MVHTIKTGDIQARSCSTNPSRQNGDEWPFDVTYFGT